MRHRLDTPDHRVAALAARDWGVVSAAELLACGLSRGEIVTRVRKGHLHRLHRGVFAVGHRHVATEGRWLAAVKACGERAVLSHYAAAALWGLVVWDGRPVDVTIPGAAPRAHPRVRVHRTTRPERVRRRNLPVTPPFGPSRISLRCWRSSRCAAPFARPITDAW